MAACNDAGKGMAGELTAQAKADADASANALGDPPRVDPDPIIVDEETMLVRGAMYFVEDGLCRAFDGLQKDSLEQVDFVYVRSQLERAVLFSTEAVRRLDRLKLRSRR